MRCICHFSPLEKVRQIAVFNKLLANDLTLRLKRRRAGWGIRGKGRVRKERKGGQERGMTSGFAGW